MTESPKPQDFLRVLINRRIRVQLLGHREMLGLMHGYDEHCNLLLSDVQDTVTVTGPDGARVRHTRAIDLLFIRGDRVITVSPARP
jgi:U6 snRNA-associated Sm-like protein LSm3